MYMHLQASPHIGEVKQIHIYKGPSDKSLFLHTAPPVKSTPPSPQLFHQEDATEKYQFNIFLLWLDSPIWAWASSFRRGFMITSSVITTVIFTTFVCSDFNFSVSCSSDMAFCMTYLQTWRSTQPYVADTWLSFSFLCCWRPTHVTKFSYAA
jgi:hypothetical protein